MEEYENSIWLFSRLFYFRDVNIRFVLSTLAKEKLSSCSEVILNLEDSKKQTESQFDQMREENLNLVTENIKVPFIKN